MKQIFSLFLLLTAPFLFGQAGQGEIPKNLGYLRFMNLVDAGSGKTTLKIDGKNVKPSGFSLGQRSGAVPFKAGTLKFVLSKEGCLSAEREVKIAVGQSKTVVAFAEEVFDEEGQSLGWQIKLATLEQHTPESGLMVTFVSFCKEDALDLEIREAMTGKTYKQTVNKRRTARVKLVEEGRVRATVTCQGETLGRIRVDEHGNYVAMIFEGDDGKRKMETFYDPEFLVSGG